MIRPPDCDNEWWLRPPEAGLNGPEVSYRPMVDNLHDPAPPQASSDDVEHLRVEEAMTDSADNRSFGAKLRMIILLSLICWAVLIAAAVWIVG